MTSEGGEAEKLADKELESAAAAVAIISENNDEQGEHTQDERSETAIDKLSRQSVILPVKGGAFEFRARELGPTALIKRVDIEECYVKTHDSQTPNQIDRTYHITISTDAADDTPAHQETVRFLTTDVMRSFNANNTMASEDNYNTSQSNIAPAAAAARRQRSTDREDELAALAAEQQLQQQQQQQMAAASANNQQATRPTPIADEMSQDLQYLSREAPLDGGESTFGAYSTLGGSQLVGQQQHQQQDVAQQQQQLTRTPTPGADQSQSELENDYERTTDFRITGDDGGDETNGAPIALVGAEQLARQQQRSQQQLEQLAPDNVDIQRPLQQAGLTVSFTTTTMDERSEEVLEQQQQLNAADLANSAQPIDFELEFGEQDKANQPLAQVGAVVEPTTRPKSALTNASRRLKPFLVSFMVDARGGAMRGCRHSGVRVIIPPNSAPQPMRITCRYLRRERLVHPPPLMEGEACASKIMEVGPAGAKFLGPVLIEVPHFASLRGKEREIIILRSDSGEVWREHLVETDDELIDSILHSAELVEQQQQQQENQRPVSPAPGGGLSDGGGGGGGDSQQQQQEKRLTRIVTTEFPQYFAIISRIRQEVHTIGPDGSVVDSQVVPRVQAIFTDGALTKRIKIGLQKKDASTEQVQDASEEMVGEEQRARSPVSGGRPGSSAGKRRSRFLACFGGKHGSHELGLDQLATDGELGFASGSNDDSPASSTGGDSPRHQHAIGGGHRRGIADVSDSEGDSLTLERQQRARGPPHRRRSLVAGELVPEDYYIEREPALILNVEPKTYGKRMASSSAQTDAAKSSGGMSTSTRQKGRRGLLLGARRSRSKTPMQIPYYEQEQEQEQSSQNNNKRPKSTDPGASTAYSSLESNGGDHDHELDNGARSSLSDLSEGGAAAGSLLPEVSKFRTCTVQTDSDSVTVQYVTLAAMPADASKVLSATTTTGGAGHDDGYVSGSGDAKKAAGLYNQSGGGKKSFLSSCVSTTSDDESLAKRKGDKKGRGKSSDRARTLESVRESAGSTEPANGRRSVSLSRTSDSPAGKLVETITTTTTTTMSQFLDAPAAEETLSNGEEADESLLTSTHSGQVSPQGRGKSTKKSKLSKAEKADKLRLKELERQRQRESEAAEKARKKVEKEARKEAERLEKLERKSGSRAQSPAPAAEQRPAVITSDSDGQSTLGATTTATTTKITQNVKFAPSPNKDYRDEPSVESVAAPEVDEQQVSSTTTTSESEKTSAGKSKSASSKFKIKLPKISLGGGGGGKGGSVDSNEETTTIERVITSEEFVPPGGQVDEDNSMVHVSIGDATMAEPKVSDEEEAEDQHEPVTSSIVESQTTTTTTTSSLPHVAETQEDVKQVVAVPLKPILKHQQSTVSEASEEPRSLASLADRVVSKATQEAVRELEQQPVTTSTEITSTTSVSVSESKREQARRAKAEKERQKVERDQAKLDMKVKRQEEKRLLKDARRAAKQAEEAAKRAEHEAKRASDEAERQAKIAQFESERTIKEIEAREASSPQSSETTATTSSEKPKRVKKEKKSKKSKVSKEDDDDVDESVERVEKETKTETSEFFLKGEQPQEQEVAASTVTSDTPTSSTNSKKISIGLPKISLDLGRKKRQVSQDEAPEEVLAEPVVRDERIGVEAKPETGLEPLITPHEEPARPASPTASKSKKQKKVRAKPRGMRMNCFRGRRSASSASQSTEDLSKSRADKQVEVTRETTEEQIAPKPVKEKRGKIRARSKLDKEEAAARKRDRRASETETAEQAPSVESRKSRGFLSRIFRPRSPRARPTSPKQRQVELVRSQEDSHFDLAPSKQADREQMIVSEMYPSDPNNADGEMILEVNVPEELIREQRQQPTQVDPATTTMVTKTSDLVSARPESPTTEPQPTSQQQVGYHVTSTTAPTFATSDDQEATLVNVSQLAADEEADEDEATENVVSQTQELPRDPVAPAPVDEKPPPPNVESDDEKVEVTRVITEEQITEEPSEFVSKEVTREVLEQVENVPDPKREKERKELEAKLEREAKRRAKEDEKLRKKREKDEAKLAVLEAKRAAKEEKERVKREAKEAKRLAELAKRESKRASKTDKKTVAAAATEPASSSTQVVAQVGGEQDQAAGKQPTTITTTTITTSSTTRGDESALNTQLDSTVAGERVLASSSTSEVPVNEETEVERIVEEVMGEDGTLTKTTKVVETKYVTMRQEEVRVAERKDIPREEWERIQAERVQPSGSGSGQQQVVVPTSGRASGDGSNNIIETYRTKKHYIVREPAAAAAMSYPTPELDEIRATPSCFDPAQLPAEIKPQSSLKKQFAKRVRLNQRIIKRAHKLSRTEAKKAKRDQRRAESEIAVCDCAARQARKELKRAVQEAKRAVKEAEKRHKKMDKIDKEIAKRQKKLEKRQKKIDKKLAKLAKKQAKKQAKLDKRALKEGTKRSSSSTSKSIRLEDIGAPVLRSSSRASIQQLAAGGSPGGGSQATAGIERHLIITEEGTRTHVMRQSSQDSQVSKSQVVVARSPETIVIDESGGQQVVDEPSQQQQQDPASSSISPEVPMSLDDATLMVQQEQQQLAHRESIASASGGQLTGGDIAAYEQQEQPDIERFKREAEHAAAMQRELEAAREEDDEVIDVVGVDEDKPEEGGDESVAAEISGQARGAMIEHKLDQENEPPVEVDVDVEAQVADASESPQAEREEKQQDSSNGGTPSKKSKKNKKKKQKSTESAT